MFFVIYQSIILVALTAALLGLWRRQRTLMLYIWPVLAFSLAVVGFAWLMSVLLWMAES